MSRRVNVHHYHHAETPSARGVGWTIFCVLVFLGLMIKIWFLWAPVLALCLIGYGVNKAVKADQKELEKIEADHRLAAQAREKQRRLLDPHDDQSEMTHDLVMHTLHPDVTQAILTNLKKAGS